MASKCSFKKIIIDQRLRKKIIKSIENQRLSLFFRDWLTGFETYKGLRFYIATKFGR